MTATAVKAARNGHGKPKYELLSIQKIAFRCGLDRATCKKRLDALKYKPQEDRAKLKLYRFDEAMEAALIETNDKLADVRVRKETAVAQLKEIEVREAMGELASVAEFTDVVQRVFSALHKEVVIKTPKSLAARLAKAKTAADVDKLLTHHLERIFNTLRNDWMKYLGNGKK